MNRSDAKDLAAIARQGVEFCRAGQWDRGLSYLKEVAEADSRPGDLPGLYYSYLGYAIAALQNRIHDGVELCRHAVRIEFYQADNYLNLARTHLLDHNRAAAVRAVEQGLKIDASHRGLLELRKKLGVRRRPVVRFLSRGNPLNQILGQIRKGLGRR